MPFRENVQHVIFQSSMHNKRIRNKTDAWLTFFSSDKPEDIGRLLEIYPEFKPMYEDIYKLCANTEKVMGMFSEELYELDKNTVKFMMDEMQEEIDGLKEQNDGLKEQIADLRKRLSQYE